jgi:UDP-N-acetylglucosamine 4,6-dehydratase
MFDDRSILITGGTGTFGQRAVHTLLTRFAPRRLVVFSRDEHKQHEMARVHDAPCMRFFLGDVRDRSRLTDAMHGIDFVIHAAALKHVGAAEYNPTESIRTNIMGAENIVHAALANDVDRVIAMSTDKAVNPVNLYGATKLVADKLIAAANNIAGTRRTRFAVVRYGNVAGSRGSVVPFFRELIDGGADHLPITDPRMTRFWLAAQTGVDFVLDAFQRMLGGEVLIPRAPSLRIVDLATAMAPGLPQRVIGIRPGEKLHEVLCPRDEAHRTLAFPRHYVIRPAIALNREESDYAQNGVGERGTPVPDDFSYQSDANDERLDVAALRALPELAAR